MFNHLWVSPNFEPRGSSKPAQQKEVGLMKTIIIFIGVCDHGAPTTTLAEGSSQNWEWGQELGTMAGHRDGCSITQLGWDRSRVCTNTQLPPHPPCWCSRSITHQYIPSTSQDVDGSPGWPILLMYHVMSPWGDIWSIRCSVCALLKHTEGKY